MSLQIEYGHLVDLADVVAALPAKLERVDHALENLVAITDMARASVQRGW